MNKTFYGILLLLLFFYQNADAQSQMSAENWKSNRALVKFENYLEQPSLFLKSGTATKEVMKIIPAENSTMLGIDGLYFFQNSLIAIQNGVLVRMVLSKDLSKVEKYEVAEANNPLFDDIKLGVSINKEFYFIANSHWESLKNGGKFNNPEKLKDVIILKLKL